MSATTDRVDRFARDAAPYPFTPSDITAAAYNPHLFSSLYALTQAYPHLRHEIVRLERHNAALVAENAALAGERAPVLRDQVTRLERRNAALVAENAALVAERDQAARAMREAIQAGTDALGACRERCARLLAGDPARLELAVRLAESVDPHHAGARGVWLWVDGDALTAWRSAS